MGKADDLLRTMGGTITESASHRGAPAAMPTDTAVPNHANASAAVPALADRSVSV